MSGFRLYFPTILLHIVVAAAHAGSVNGLGTVMRRSMPVNLRIPVALVGFFFVSLWVVASIAGAEMRVAQV